MTIIRRASAAALVATILVALAPLAANKTIDVDTATIAELNAAFDAGTLTAEIAGADVPRAHRRPTTARARRCTP